MAGLPSWAPASRSPPGMDSPEAARGTGPLPVLLGWRAGGQQRAEAQSAWVPVQVGRRGHGQWPCSQGPGRAQDICCPSCGSGWAHEGLVPSGGGWQLQFLCPGQGGAGTRVERFFFTVWKRWEGAQMREVGASARKTPPEPGARGPGSGGGSPACGSRLRVSWRCRPCRESWWGRRALLLLLVAGRV